VIFNKTSTKTIGDQAESTAEKFLQNNKLKIIERNYRSRLGEIDIIAEDKGTLVFIEVKFRKSISHGLPYETVTASKQCKIIRTAESYLQKSRCSSNKACRFDVISIHNQDINWIKNAFDTTN